MQSILFVSISIDIYLTGSNSKLLSGELATYLSGRYIQIQVFLFAGRSKKQCIENLEPILRMKALHQTI